nr:WRKY [Loropetalum chinense var. rubrum]WGV38262.1 WRKY [Loropetalum chinense var. rubrum]
MEEETTKTAAASDNNVADEKKDLSRNDLPANLEHGGGGGTGGWNGARYKLMSPAKLPISRSVCITIPPGLSPTSFLESPVLLSNMKAEPSPTTGSFSKPQLTHGSIRSATFSSNTSCFNTNTFDERKSSFFEFKLHNRLNSVSGLPSVGPLVSADFNHQQGERFVQVQGQCQTQTFASSPSVKNEVAVSSNELSLSSPVHMVPSKTSVPAEGDSDELDQRGHSNTGVQSSQSDHKGIGPSVMAERSSDDGYNWRKYGQKLVKGSEYPRSYYKCTHPNCEVKKLFERSHDGQITEIIYKGTHDHPKPQPSRRFSAGTIMSIQEERPGRDDKSSGTYGHIAHNIESSGALELSPVTTNVDSIEGAGSQLNRINDEVDDDDPFSKRRKMDNGGIDVIPVVKPIREPRVVVQTLSEVDILDDGYRWRKYGQKVVRGNPNPRSYYKCTNAGCPVRKHVERASHDPKAVITTYEGKHNHDVPTAKTNSHDMAGPTAANGISRIGAEESDTISLDLGVGISSAAENRSNEQQQQQTQHAERGQGQQHVGGSNFRVIQATPVRYYGLLSVGTDQYGISRANRVEGRSFEIPPLNHSSNPYPQNMGRVLMGP